MAETPSSPHEGGAPASTSAPSTRPTASAAKPETKAEAPAPKVPLQPTQVRQNPNPDQAIVDRIEAMEAALSAMKADAEESNPASRPPSDLEQSMIFGIDYKATNDLRPSQAKAILAEKLGEGFDVDELMDYSVRGPYLIGVLKRNGDKVAVMHDLAVESTPLLGELPRAMRSDEYDQERQSRASQGPAT